MGETSDSVDVRRRVGGACSRAFTLPCDPATVRRLRQQLQHDEGIVSLDPATRTNVLLVASELLTNAIAACTVSHVHVVVEIEPGWVGIEVRNEGIWVSPPRDGVFHLPAATAGRGRGLAIVSRLAEDLRIRVDGTTTTVSARIRT